MPSNKWSEPVASGDALFPGSADPLYAFGFCWNGSGWDRRREANVFKSINAVAVTAGTPANVWTPAAGKKFRLLGWAFSSNAAAALILCDNAAGNPIVRTPLLAAAGIDKCERFGNGFLSAAINNILKIDVSATSTVTGYVFGTEE